ncbi:LysR substrate-binding domain-containing protein [Roseiterribacter gracilis]|uniref:LysR family transcriptional regulator n=1 Tax=Roseiterribacter gracilis TaxID=2812848 RepID=A0A8S8X8E5_9PROT|nr:LysR family transcriptional regulator [Rhodospirillales bacterium TMPK1]
MARPSLPALRAFEAAARLASFKEAASELFVTPTAISHQLKQLETQLGVRVLDRSPRAVTLTDDGRVLFDAVTSAFATIDIAIDRLQQQQTTKVITLSATTSFLSQWLVPRLDALRRALPDLDLRLHASVKLAELRPGTVDVAIRYGKGPFNAVDAVALRADQFAPVCSPSLRIARPQDLQQARLIHVDGRVAPRPAPDWRRWCDAANVTGIDVTQGLRFTDSLHAVQAAIAGHGIAIVSLVLVADALAAGLLVQPFAMTLPGETYHFACAPALRERADIARLRDWFRDTLAA